MNLNLSNIINASLKCYGLKKGVLEYNIFFNEHPHHFCCRVSVPSLSDRLSLKCYQCLGSPGKGNLVQIQ